MRFGSKLHRPEIITKLATMYCFFQKMSRKPTLTKKLFLLRADVKRALSPSTGKSPLQDTAAPGGTAPGPQGEGVACGLAEAELRRAAEVGESSWVPQLLPPNAERRFQEGGGGESTPAPLVGLGHPHRCSSSWLYLGLNPPQG